MIKLMQGDCLERMKEIPDNSVDMVLTDPPYGTTACKWDSVIPLEPMWVELKRVIKPTGAIVMTASQPFTTRLIASNMGQFKYCWVWNKNKAANFFNCNYQPLKTHEDIVVFGYMATSYSDKGSMNYYPQKIAGKPYKAKRGDSAYQFNQKRVGYISQSSERYPVSIVNFTVESGLHPTQKPVALMEYLIKTYTNEGETVLDFAMGSGTTGVACKNLGRSFIGIELDQDYFNIAKERIEND